MTIRSKQTDLIRGAILTDILKPIRFFGNIHYYCGSSRICDGSSCSFLDKGNDPGTDLLVQLFPSCGVELNTQCRGTLEFVRTMQKESLFIAGMFKIDAIVRERKKDYEALFGEISYISEIIHKIEGLKSGSKTREKLDGELKEKLKNFAEKYFFGVEETEVKTAEKIDGDDKKVEKKVKKKVKEYLQSLFRLGKNITNTILLERSEEEAVTDAIRYEKPYPPFWGNNMICAYAWNTISPGKLDELAGKLGYEEGRPLYESKLTKQIIDEIHKNPSLVPFYPGQQIITNSVTEYKGKKFADCVETTMRQFFACVLCESILDAKNEFTGELRLNLNRIPTSSTALREFFAPDGAPRNIRELANDGSSETRREWAIVMGGHPGISYVHGDYEMHGGWNNLIKMFCFLMDGYTATQDGQPVTLRKLAAEKRIRDINNAIKTGTFVLKKEELLPILNDLIGVRTDVELTAEAREITEKDSEVEGYVVVYPKNHQSGNQLTFFSDKRHAQLYAIFREKPSDSTDLSGASWIELFHSDRDLAIKGKKQNLCDLYPPLSESTYPQLDFCLRLSGGIRWEWEYQTMCDILKSPVPHIESIVRQFFGFENCEYELAEFIKVAQEKTVPMPILIDICYSIAKYADSPGNTVPAIKFLQKHASDKAEEFKTPISSETKPRDLIIQRCVFDCYEKVDPIIEDFIRTRPTKDVLNFLARIYASYTDDKDLSRVNLFKAQILDALIPHFKKIKDGDFTDDIETYGPVAILDLVDFAEVPPIVKELVDKFKSIQPAHFFPLFINESRKQAKLELLLPISSAMNARVSDRIFEEYRGEMTSEIVTSIITKISDEKILMLISKLPESELSIDLVRKLLDKDNPFMVDAMYSNEGKRVKQIMNALAERYGKFNYEIAEYLINMYPPFLLNDIMTHVVFDSKLKDFLISKYDDTPYWKDSILLLLLDSEYAFDTEVQRRLNGDGNFWFVLCHPNAKIKEMSDRLILNLAQYLEKAMRSGSSDYVQARWNLIKELQSRTTIAEENKKDLIEKLEAYGKPVEK